MTATALLTELSKRGIKVWPEGQTLRYRARRGAFSPALRRRVETQRGELLSLLRDRGDPPGLSRAAVLYGHAKRAIAERPARIAALVAAWGEEWVENPVYPDPAGEECGL